MNDIDKQSLGYRIRKTRQQVGMTQGEFAQMLGVNNNYVGLVERGSKNPSDRLLKRVADATGVSFDWLKTGYEISETERADFSDDHETATKEVYIEKRAPGNFKANCRLLLSLALLYTNHTKETLAKKLGVRSMVIDRILNTKGSYVEEAWIPALYEIAAELDPSVMAGEFNRMQRFIYAANRAHSFVQMEVAILDYYYSKGCALEVCATDEYGVDLVAADKNAQLKIKAMLADDVVDVEGGLRTRFRNMSREEIAAELAIRFEIEKDGDTRRTVFVTPSYGVFSRMKNILRATDRFKNSEVLLWNRQKNEIIAQADASGAEEYME